MYLNVSDISIPFLCSALEPTHEMYLNKTRTPKDLKSLNLEPTHEMYLNLPIRGFF